MENQQIEEKLDKLDQRLDNFQIFIENVIMKQLQLLAEGQRTILETLAPKTKTDELSEDVDLLKSVVRTHSQQIAELEKKISA